MFSMSAGEVLSSSRHPLPVSLLREKPNRLVSLWEMVNYQVGELFKTLSYCTWEINQMFRIERERGAGSQLTEDERQRLIRLSDCMCREFENLEMTAGSDQLFRLGLHLPTITITECRTRLTTLRELLESELKKQKFFFIPKDKAAYFDVDAPFGQTVRDQFPNGNREARAAGNCLAINLPDASVFHSMRCAEYGMRALAKDRRIKFNNMESIEFAEWGMLIQALEKAASTVLQRKGRSHAKSDALEHYNGSGGAIEGVQRRV